jgi:hypothetical protein
MATQTLRIGGKDLVLKVTPPDEATRSIGFGIDVRSALEAQEKSEGITLSDMLSAIGGDAFEAFPPQLSGLDTISLYQLNGSLHPEVGIEALHVSFGYDASVDLVPGFLTLERLAVRLGAERSSDDGPAPLIWHADITARLVLGKSTDGLMLDLHGRSLASALGYSSGRQKMT